MTKAKKQVMEAAIESLGLILQDAENIDGAPVVYFNIESVAKSGMSRKMRFWIVNRANNSFGLVNITKDMAEAGCNSYKNGELAIRGCGMDMVWAAADDALRGTQWKSANNIYLRAI